MSLRRNSVLILRVMPRTTKKMGTKALAKVLTGSAPRREAARRRAAEKGWVDVGFSWKDKIQHQPIQKEHGMNASLHLCRCPTFVGMAIPILERKTMAEPTSLPEDPAFSLVSPVALVVNAGNC